MHVGLLYFMFCCYNYHVLVSMSLAHFAATTCSELTPLVNGRINYFTDTTAPFDFNTVASHLCDTGYGIEGDVDRICSGDGSSPVGVWSSTTTTCGGTYSSKFVYTLTLHAFRPMLLSIRFDA